MVFVQTTEDFADLHRREVVTVVNWFEELISRPWARIPVELAGSSASARDRERPVPGHVFRSPT
jgi:hypothetical protein